MQPCRPFFPSSGCERDLTSIKLQTEVGVEAAPCVPSCRRVRETFLGGTQVALFCFLASQKDIKVEMFVCLCVCVWSKLML